MSNLPVTAIDVDRLHNIAPVVVDVVFGPYDRNSGLTAVRAEFSDGTVDFSLTVYADEIGFSRGEFLGKTRRQVQLMFYERDQAYLRS